MKYELHLGDSLEILPTLADCSVDSIVTDPPYHLTSIVKRFGKEGSAPAKFGTDGVYARASRGFMGQEWDGGDVAFRTEIWEQCLRVLKPGGHLLAFSGSRTYHRMTCAIEDAGFEIRDQIMWLYGSGFPKSRNVCLDFDKMDGGKNRGHRIAVANRYHPDGTLEPNGENLPAYEAKSENGKKWQGWGTALKPAHEPICVARKPLIGTVAENVQTYGTGAINVDGCRVEGDSWGTRTNGSQEGKVYGLGIKGGTEQVASYLGRWPANIIHDGLEEEWARFFYCAKASKRDRDEGLDGFERKTVNSNLNTKNGSGERLDGGTSAIRANHHPTVKPTDLMRYLCRLVTPPNGLILDHFMGSGSTGKAAMLEGFRFVGIDMTAEYVEIARARIEHAAQTPRQGQLL